MPHPRGRLRGFRRQAPTPSRSRLWIFAIGVRCADRSPLTPAAGSRRAAVGGWPPRWVRGLGASGRSSTRVRSREMTLAFQVGGGPIPSEANPRARNAVTSQVGATSPMSHLRTSAHAGGHGPTTTADPGTAGDQGIDPHTGGIHPVNILDRDGQPPAPVAPRRCRAGGTHAPLHRRRPHHRRAPARHPRPPDPAAPQPSGAAAPDTGSVGE